MGFLSFWWKIADGYVGSLDQRVTFRPSGREIACLFGGLEDGRIAGREGGCAVCAKVPGEANEGSA